MPTREGAVRADRTTGIVAPATDSVTRAMPDVHPTTVATEIPPATVPHGSCRELPIVATRAPLPREDFGPSAVRDRHYSRAFLADALLARRIADAQDVAELARLRADFARVMSAGAIAPHIPEVL